MNTLYNKPTSRVPILVFVAVVVLLLVSIPIFDGLGVRLSEQNPETLAAQAGLTQAQAELARARLEELSGEAAASQARADVYNTYPEILNSFGNTAVQVGMALALILAGFGAFWLMFVLGVNLGSHGVVRVKNYKEPPVAISVKSTAAGQLPDAYMATGLAAERIGRLGYGVTNPDGMGVPVRADTRGAETGDSPRKDGDGAVAGGPGPIGAKSDYRFGGPGGQERKAAAHTNASRHRGGRGRGQRRQEK